MAHYSLRTMMTLFRPIAHRGIHVEGMPGSTMFAALMLHCSFFAIQADASSLTALPAVQLCHAGDGLWDLKLAPKPPEGKAVDNDGRIYICDPHRDRILVFTRDAEPQEIITNNVLSAPWQLQVDEKNDLIVTGARDGHELQFEAWRRDGSWRFRQLEKKTNLVMGAIQKRGFVHEIDGEVTPFGRDQLRYLQVWDWKEGDLLKLVDRNGKYVKSVPSELFDKKGRYYGRCGLDGQRSIYGEDGKVLGRWSRPSRQLVKYKGWIYAVECVRKQHEDLCYLRRYGADGTVEHEIEVKGDMPTIYVSPNGEHLFSLGPDWNKDKVFTIWVTRFVYEE